MRCARLHTPCLSEEAARNRASHVGAQGGLRRAIHQTHKTSGMLGGFFLEAWAKFHMLDSVTAEKKIVLGFESSSSAVVLAVVSLVPGLHVRRG